MKNTGENGALSGNFISAPFDEAVTTKQVAILS